MQFTKVRGIAGRADGKARHLVLKDSVAVRRADPSERSQRESLWRLRARPFERSPVCEFVCINKISKALNSKEHETWFESVMAWWTKIKEHYVMNLQRCRSLPHYDLDQPPFMQGGWFHPPPIQTAVPLWESTSEDTIWYIPQVPWGYFLLFLQRQVSVSAYINPQKGQSM